MGLVCDLGEVVPKKLVLMVFGRGGTSSQSEETIPATAVLKWMA